MGWYIIFWLLGLPIGVLLKVFLLRLLVSAGWWLICGLFFVLCVIWGMIPQKAKDFMKGMLVFAIIGFCISCFF